MSDPETVHAAQRTRPGGRSARVRASVLQAAMDAVAELGYDQVCMEDVAAAAGVHKTTVYRRWPTKAELVIDALLEHGDQEVTVPDTGSLAGDLAALGRLIAANLTTTEGRRTARSLVAATTGSVELEAQGQEFWAEHVARTRLVVERGIERGEVAAATDPGLVIEALLGTLWGRALLTGEPLDAKTIRQVAGMIAAGVAPVTPPA